MISEGTDIMGHYLPDLISLIQVAWEVRTHKIFYLKQVQKYS